MRYTIVLLLLAQFSWAQQLETLEKELAFHADNMTNAIMAEHRQRSAESFDQLFNEAIALPNSFSYDFASIKWISNLKSPDGQFRILSWLVAGEDNVSTPYGYIQFADGRVQVLKDDLQLTADTEYEMLDADTWLGAIYYKIMRNGDKKDSYILMGYRQSSKFDKQKVLEVLTLKDNEIVFGDEVFVKPIEGSRDEVKTRILLTYSSDSNTTLNYNEQADMIVMDHLISRMGQQEGQGPTFYSDGSYIGYKYENGKYIYVDRLFDQVSAVPPRPKPVLGKEKSNLFGKKSTKSTKKRN